MKESTRVIECPCCGEEYFKMDLAIITSELFECATPNCKEEIKILTEEK